MSRVYDNGYPWDTVIHTRFSNLIRSSLPWTLLKWVTEKKMNEWFDHENYGLVPQNRYSFFLMYLKSSNPLDNAKERESKSFNYYKYGVKSFL